MIKNIALSYWEILEKLKWFHGEEFDKYPLTSEFQRALELEHKKINKIQLVEQ